MSSKGRFGRIFRQRREALDLTLREFCRRNGFDAAKISRLERGLTKPPRPRKILESYAKALKLEPTSSEWQRFMDLADADAGRIPPEMMENPALAEKLPKVLRGLRGRTSPQWVKATELESWAECQEDARSRVPQLLRRLIHATVDSLVRIEFPAGEQGQRPGWDGIVETPSGNAFVPSGLSGWEIGVGQDPRTKAEEDLRKRVKDSRGLDRSQMSFVFVTPRKWVGKGQWCDEKNNLRIWKEVRVYDSTNLEEWLETAPAVDRWFARILGVLPAGVTDIEDHWANLAPLSDPSLKPEVFLASRNDEVKTLTAWLKGPPSSLAFEARSPPEVIDFVAAYRASLDERESDVVAARTVIVDERDAWRGLCAAGKRLVLIPRPNLEVDAEMVAEAIRQGHSVLLCSERFPSEPVPKFTLSRVRRGDLGKALVSSGFDQERASELARDSGGSLTVLKRRIARFPSTSQPEWSRPTEAEKLVPILLAGGWDETNAADRAILARLAGRSYEELLSVANRWLNAQDPPVMHVLTRWRLVSREDSWELLATYLTGVNLDAFEAVAIEVLGEVDPRYELSPDKRWQAPLYGKVPKHSAQLRTGVAETLALMGAKPDKIQDAIGATQRAECVVRQLLGDGSTWRRWASLSYHLPLLAEAAPDEFLSAVERDLRAPKPELMNLFNQEGEPPFGSSPHTGLLWAIETLAWERSLLTRVSLILARLAQSDPDGTLGNSPMASLREIFLPWFPQTTASVQDRIRVLKQLTKQDPDVGWRLLLSLLPKVPDISIPTQRPTWRDWAANWSPGATYSENWQQVEACAGQLLESVGSDARRWRDLIGKLEAFPEPAQRRLLDGLKGVDPSTVSTQARREIADLLRERVNRHHRFADADTALPPAAVTALEEVHTRFEPPDPVARHTWLFAAYPRLAGESAEERWQVREERLLELRREALKEVLAANGIEGILTLAAAAESPESVGYVLGKAKLLNSDAPVLPGLIASDDHKTAGLARGYVWGRSHDSGWDWVESLPWAEWSAKEAGILASCLSFERRTWELASRLGSDATEHYWRRARGFCRNPRKQDIDDAVSMFLRYGCPFQAFGVLAMALHDKCEVEPSLLMDALEAGLNLRDGIQPDGPIANHIAGDIWLLFKHLQKRLESGQNVDASRLGALEWGYLRVLERHGVSAKALHTLLGTDAKFFAKILSMLFRSRRIPRGSAEPATKDDIARAENGYRLLRSWKTLPGTRDDGTVDEDKLMEWVSEARRLCGESGRAEVCDSKIGEMLGRSEQKESDGSWPCVPVRDLIEESGTDELVRGFAIGIFNKRGMCFRSTTEGGKEERALAQQYKSYAEACDIEWPRTAAALRRVAQGYEDQARREDEEAQDRD